MQVEGVEVRGAARVVEEEEGAKRGGDGEDDGWREFKAEMLAASDEEQVRVDV